jgi:hypothetical protein
MTHYLTGANYWAQWGRGPKFELFKLIGTEPGDKTKFVFISKNQTKIIKKSMSDLISDMSFRPFLIDTAVLNKGSIYSIERT